MAKLSPITKFIASYEIGIQEHSDSVAKPAIIQTFYTQCAHREKAGANGACVRSKVSLEDIEIWEDFYPWLQDIQNQNIANSLADWLWSSGTEAISGVQQIVGITPSGDMNEKTLDAINMAQPSYLFGNIRFARLHHIDKLIQENPELKAHEASWYRRINAINFGYLVSSTLNRITW